MRGYNSPKNVSVEGLKKKKTNCWPNYKWIICKPNEFTPKQQMKWMQVAPIDLPFSPSSCISYWFVFKTLFLVKLFLNKNVMRTHKPRIFLAQNNHCLFLMCCFELSFNSFVKCKTFTLRFYINNRRKCGPFTSCLSTHSVCRCSHAELSKMTCGLFQLKQPQTFWEKVIICVVSGETDRTFFSLQSNTSIAVIMREDSPTSIKSTKFTAL